MLSYAFTTLTPAEDDEIAAEEFDNIHNLFAAILSKGIGQQLKQGLYREYLNRKEEHFFLEVTLIININFCMANQ